MSEGLLNLAIVASVLGPIVIFGLLAFYRLPDKDDGDSLDDFLYAGGIAETHDFSRSSVAYMLQIYVTFYFIFWGYNYGFSNIFYVLGWGIGLGLFVWQAPRIIAATARHETLANILSQHHRDLQLVFGFMSAIYFVGMLYLETHFAADFLDAAVASEAAPSASWWIVFGFLLVFVVLYSSWGGIRKIFLTDRHQLGAAYFGFGVLLMYLLSQGFQANPASAVVLALVILAIYGYLAFVYGPKGDSLSAQLFMGVSFFGLLLVSIYGLLSVDSIQHLDLGAVDIPMVLEQIREPGGSITLIGFTILNVLWQFCDASNYQRVRAIYTRCATKSEMETVIRDDFRPLIIASPVTWGLGIVMGMGIKVAGITVGDGETEYGAFIADLAARITESGEMGALVGLIGLGIAVSSIMLSTADSSVLAYFQIVMRDVLKVNKWRGWLVAVLAASMVVMAGGIAVMVRQFEVDYIFTIVASFNSQILVAAPAILLVLSGRFHRGILMTSVVMGSIAVWWGTFNPPGVLLEDRLLAENILLVFPILAGLAAALAPLVLGGAFGMLSKRAVGGHES